MTIAELRQRWAQFVGPGLALQSRPEAVLARGVLLVHVRNYYALRDLRPLEQVLQKRLPSVDDIRIREITWTLKTIDAPWPGGSRQPRGQGHGD
jgi:hypothetical protein